MFVYITNTRVTGLVFLLLFSGYLYFAGDIPLDFWSEEEVFNARSMPYLIGSCGIICSVLLIAAPGPVFNWSRIRELNWLPALLLLVTTSIYGLVLESLGFLVSTSLLLTIAFAILGERKWLKMTAIAIGIAVIFWLLMDALGIYLAPGLLLSGDSGA